MANEVDALDDCRLLSGRQVAELCSISYWTWLAWCRNPLVETPRPIVLSSRTKRWRATDIRDFIRRLADEA